MTNNDVNPQDSTGFPLAATPDGCVVMDGGTSTVSVAALLVTLPKPLVATTVKAAPLSEELVGGVV